MLKQDKQEKQHKKLLPIFLLLLSVAMIGGISLAYFSDIITSEGKVTAGTLDIVSITGTSTDPDEGAVKMYLNGDTTALTDNTIANFNPGDVVVIKADIKNDGNKSAWIRTLIAEKSGTTTTFTKESGAIKYIKIAEGEHTSAEMMAGTGITMLTLPYTQSTPKILNGKYTSIDGSGVATYPTDSETETSGIAQYQDAFTIYFDKDAENSEQGKELNFEVKVQAMQYRNNSTPVWENVVTTAFSLGD